MLFDPFEEQFDLPATSVQLSNRQSWQGEIVGQEDERLVSFGILESNAA